LWSDRAAGCRCRTVVRRTASRPTLEAFRSDVPVNRNRSHFWRRTAHLPFTEPTISSTWARSRQSVCSIKVPQTITHDKILMDGNAELAEFLETMHILRPKLGPIVFQFPFFTSSTFPDRHAFNDRLLRPEWLHSSSRWAGPVGTHEISAARDRLCALDDLLNCSFAGKAAEQRACG